MNKRILKRVAIVAVGLSIGWTIGCAQPKNVTPVTVAPGYLNAADQQMGEILSGAHAFYQSIQQQTQAGTLTLGPTIKQDFNAFGVSLNAAQSVYLAYHAGSATQAQAQAAVTEVQTQQAALPLPGAK